MQVVWNEWMDQWYDTSTGVIINPYVTTPFYISTAATTTGIATAVSNYFVSTGWQAATPQERRVTQEAMAAQRRASAAVMVVRDEADKKAHALLLSILTPAQRKSYEMTAHFDLALTRKDGTVVRYRITKGSAGNIYRLDEQGRLAARFCIHAEGGYPDADHMVAQKLLLESDEEKFLRIANKTDLALPVAFGGIAA